MSIGNKILKLSKQLLPTGKAWRAALDSNEERLFKALAMSKEQFHSDALSILTSLLPDNDGFTADDATDWERRLALTGSAATPLATRMAAILRKMKAPGVNPAKGHYLWLQQQLQDAGFNVYVYENLFPTYPGDGYTSTNPAIWNGLILSKNYLDDFQLGDMYLDKYLNNVAIRDLDLDKDVYWSFWPDQRATFFISAGPGTLGVYANIPSSRREEFRQLLLSLKQTQTVGVLYINY